jgi:hypothetical protein
LGSSSPAAITPELIELKPIARHVGSPMTVAGVTGNEVRARQFGESNCVAGPRPGMKVLGIEFLNRREGW